MRLRDYYQSTSKITKLAFKQGSKIIGSDVTETDQLMSIGSSLGALAYCIDARDDRKMDSINNTFNPIGSSKYISPETVDQCIAVHSKKMAGDIKLLDLSMATKDKYVSRLSQLALKKEEQDPNWREKTRRRRPSDQGCCSSVGPEVCCEGCSQVCCLASCESD